MLQDLINEITAQLPLILSLRADFTMKPDNSYVSKGDLKVEEIVMEFFKTRQPSHLVISEEQKYDPDATWDPNGNYVVVDPIDGTENFVSGLREWGVGVSIYTEGKHQQSCIFLPELNESLISGQPLERFTSRIMGLSSSLNKNDLQNLPEGNVEFRIIGCSMYNMLSAVKGSFRSFENVKGVNCWDVLPGLNLALEHGVTAYVDGTLYTGQILFPTKKYRIKLINA